MAEKTIVDIIDRLETALSDCSPPLYLFDRSPFDLSDREDLFHFIKNQDPNGVPAYEFRGRKYEDGRWKKVFSDPYSPFYIRGKNKILKVGGGTSRPYQATYEIGRSTGEIGFGRQSKNYLLHRFLE